MIKKLMAILFTTFLVFSSLVAFGEPTEVSADTPQYLTFTAEKENSWVNIYGVSGDLQYSVNGGEWTTYNLNNQIDLPNAGDTVSFRGENYKSGGSNHVTMYGKIAASGDVTSLLNNNGGDYELVDNQFRYMFKGCTSLTSAPALPSTTLKKYCYANMFDGCTSLTSAPALPATKLNSNCYQHMFDGCTSLTSAPKLPATTLVGYCYSYMFNGCTSLTSAPALPATKLEGNCYEYMFKGCTSLTSAPTLPATELKSCCYRSMFEGCTSLASIPVLPAEGLAIQCYKSMFKGCSNIKLSATKTGNYQAAYRIPTSGTGTVETNSLTDMFAETGGTFTETPSINTIYYLAVKFDVDADSANKDLIYGTSGTAKYNVTVDGFATSPTSYTINFYSDNECENDASDYLTGSYSNGVVTVTPTNANAGDYYMVLTSDVDSGSAKSSAIKITINKAKVTVPTAVTGLIYNGSSQTGVTLPQDAKYTLSGNTDTNVGDHTATATLTDKDNYAWDLTTPTSDNQSISWSITKKEIKITADDKSSRVGSDLVTLTYTRDTNTTLCGTDTLSGSLSTNADKTTAGTYNITQGDLTAGNNYDIKFTAGTYTVTAKDAQTLTFTDSTITKNNGDAKFTQKVSGANTTVTYSSSDANVATVNSSTGEVTIVGSGTATITATAAENTTYASASKSYTLVVRPKANSDKSNVTINGNKLSASLTKGSTSDRNIDFDMSIANDSTIGHVNLVKNQDNTTYSNKDSGGNERITITSGQNTINPDNYVITSGSIKISLKKDYLDTLAAGTHDYQISIKDNGGITYTYDLSVTINNPSSSSGSTYQVVKTGIEGTNNTLKLVSLLSLVTIAGVVTLKKKKH